MKTSLDYIKKTFNEDTIIYQQVILNKYMSYSIDEIIKFANPDLKESEPIIDIINEEKTTKISQVSNISECQDYICNVYSISEDMIDIRSCAYHCLQELWNKDSFVDYNIESVFIFKEKKENSVVAYIIIPYSKNCVEGEKNESS